MLMIKLGKPLLCKMVRSLIRKPDAFSPLMRAHAHQEIHEQEGAMLQQAQACEQAVDFQVLPWLGSLHVISGNCNGPV